uniref:hypothetical protein n=1 Tax=Angelakisella sp. TaxID=1935177 RepID=UPI003FEF9954
MKKFLSILLAILMLAVMLPVTAMADEGATGDGSQSNPYTLTQLGAMDRDAYITAQERLGGTMYVTVGNYSYDTNGVLGNGVRNDTTGQTEDRSVLNGYNSNGYLGEKNDGTKGNDGANGKNIVFVGGTITSGATGYEDIDHIGTSLLLAVPAYTHVTFQGTAFKNVISIDYQLYTGPWSQLGCVDFEGCTFDGIIVGAMATQSLVFNNCTFNNYTNTSKANNSNPTWIRPAYGNWSKGDNEGQGNDFRSLTTINFTNNKVTSTRPVKFERIAQWEMDTTLTATNNHFDISAQNGDTSTKNVGMYFGANAAFDLVVEKNTKSANTAGLYTIPADQTALPEGSTIKNTNGTDVKLTDVMVWKTTTDEKLTLDPTGNGKDENASTVIIIDRPTEDTPKTEPEKNPTTGANDVVAAAVALMAVSALGMAVLARKK